MLGDLDVPKAFERLEHRTVGDPVAVVLVVDPLGLTWFHWERRSSLGNQLLRDLIQADERTLWIERRRIDVEHVFHRRYESAARLRRNDPLLFAVRLKRVFLRTRPIVLLLARSTMPNSTTLSSREPQRPACVAFGRRGTGQRHQPGLFLAVENRRDPRLLPAARCSAQPRGPPPQIAGEPASPWTCWYPRRR